MQVFKRIQEVKNFLKTVTPTKVTTEQANVLYRTVGKDPKIYANNTKSARDMVQHELAQCARLCNGAQNEFYSKVIADGQIIIFKKTTFSLSTITA